MPILSASSLHVTKVPRYSAGAISAMYMGSRLSASPTLRPTIMRPKSSAMNPDALICTKMPQMKMDAQTVKARRRPR
eukprot:scaffold99400_cov55-Phaeocystis_antarctica.AAC.6